MGETISPTVDVELTTNTSVAARLGVNHSTVSRIRSGQRYPSRRLMRLIEETYGWKVAEQMALLPDAGRNRRYAIDFDKKVFRAEQLGAKVNEA